MAKKIGIIGASGWLGGFLNQVLRAEGVSVVGFSRSSRDSDEMEWRQWAGQGAVDLSGLDAVVNLAGEAISQRWTARKKQEFYRSRVDLTKELVESIERHQVPLLLNASGVGYYGDRGNDRLPETEKVGEQYLARLCADWEAAALASSAKVCLLRTGVVLGRGGGAWGKMEKIFRLGLGGRLGSGRQWMPWIYVDDAIGAILHCLKNELEGAVNLVAAESVTNADFTRAVGRALRRPAFLPAPAFALKLAFGDFAEEGLLASQRAVPEVLLESGYEFRYAHIEPALAELV